MKKRSNNKDRYNFIIDKSVYGEFSKICDEEGFVRSKKVEKFMKDFIEKQKEAKKKK